MNAQALRPDAHRTLLALILATVGMLFIAFTAAYLVRRTGADWERIPLPGVLWANTAILVASSVALERGRRARATPRVGPTLLLGFAFLAGQLVSWRQLRDAGIDLPARPHGTFLYTLSGVHGVHLLSGLVTLLVARRKANVFPLAAFYWHFLGGVWLYLVLVLNLL